VFPLWIITESSQYVAGPQKDASGLNLSASVLWGFAKTVFLEHPEWRGGMIDIDDDSANSEFVLKKMVKPFRENCVALRNGQQFVQQLIPEKRIPKDKVHFRCDGVYIITGGLGGLGMQSAVWLADKGVKHIILTGRRQLPEEKLWGIISEDHRDHEVIHQILALKNRGVAVEIISADIRDMPSLEKLFEGLGKREIPVRGVIHAAGVNWFSKVANLDTKAFLETLKVKVSSSWALHQLTEELDLDCFILFSSVSALWGSVELSHYTAANHFMDMLSLYRASKGLPTCCINWGPWAETGMSSPDKEADVLKKLGFQLMPPGKALLSMEAVQASSIPLSLITDIDWQKFRMFIDFSLQPSLFSQVIGKQEDSRHVEGTLLQTILSSTPGKAKEQIEEVIRMELRSVMLIESMDNINADERFNFLGMDSLMAITFVVKLEEYFNCKLPSTLAYNYPTISTVRDFIFELIYTGGESSLNENIKMAEKSNRTKNFVLLRKSDVHGKLTLFCFPGAGSGASVYTDWSHEFSSEVELISVQLPGREGRGDEKRYTSMEGIIDELVTAFEEVTGDFCFFGHSLGALIAYELYVKLKSLNRKLPERLFLSGCSAPLQPSSGKIHLLPDDAFIEEVMRNYPGSENEHERRNAMKHTCQLLRADLQVLETYQPGSERIDIPLMVICGVEDQLAPPAEVKKWDQLSGPDFLIAEINAGHNMVKENAQDLVLLIESLVNADFAVAK
jgi:surfactin synthase thioesterase subunit/short-subunit dehydrogenase/acyl carrier protein